MIRVYLHLENITVATIKFKASLIGILVIIITVAAVFCEWQGNLVFQSKMSDILALRRMKEGSQSRPLPFFKFSNVQGRPFSETREALLCRPRIVVSSPKSEEFWTVRRYLIQGEVVIRDIIGNEKWDSFDSFAENKGDEDLFERWRWVVSVLEAWNPANFPCVFVDDLRKNRIPQIGLKHVLNTFFSDENVQKPPWKETFPLIMSWYILQDPEKSVLNR